MNEFSDKNIISVFDVFFVSLVIPRKTAHHLFLEGSLLESECKGKNRERKTSDKTKAMKMFLNPSDLY